MINTSSPFLLLSITLALSSCGIKKLLPRKPVLSNNERAELTQIKQQQPNYTSAPLVNFPIIPFQIFGLTYDQDIVIVTKHPKWNMHEFACFNTPNGKLWLMKDAEEGSMDQFVTVDNDDLIDLLPEVSVQVDVRPIKITDNSDEKWMDIKFEYENALGENVVASYRGKQKMQKQKKRNGSSMGHSKNQLMVILDLPLRSFGKKASVSYDNKEYKVKKILGIKKFQMLLTQTQAGLSQGTFRLFEDEAGGLKTKHENKTATVQDWQLQQEGSQQILVQSNEFRTTSYCYDADFGLTAATIKLWDREEKAFNISIYPPLPDLRRKFEGEFRSTFVMDVNEQQSHGMGEISCHWEGEQLIIDILPLSPYWIADRPMQTVIDFEEKGVGIKTGIR